MNDNNPDIKDYMGSGDLVATYSNGGNTYSILLRNNLKSSPNRGALQANWSFPLQGRPQGYVQYFNGYGESRVNIARNSQYNGKNHICCHCS